MIDYHLLETLVTYARVGTLAKTAQVLGLTQPAISHSMQKLETDLGVQLFIRKPNKLYLSETGKYAAREAKKLLNQNENFVSHVQRFEQNQTTLTLAANAPGPLIVLRLLAVSNVNILDHFIATNYEQALIDEQVTALLINQPLNTAETTSVYLGTERMSINLPAGHPLASATTLHYHDLQAQTLISPRGIGFWQQIYHEQIPGATFIYQDESHEYSEILNYSSLPFFTTNLTNPADAWGKHLPNDRVIKPLADAIASQRFYICFLKRNQQRLVPLIEKLQDRWAQSDTGRH